jgi:hypothetical protein
MSEPSENKSGSISLYEDFLNDLLKKRHDVAHGNYMSTPDSVSELMKSRSKVLVIEYAIVLVIGHKLQQHTFS